MKKYYRAIIFLLIAFLVHGCIQIDSQEIYWMLSKNKKDLYALIIYRDIYATIDKDSKKSASEQLDSSVKEIEEDFFIFFKIFILCNEKKHEFDLEPYKDGLPELPRSGETKNEFKFFNHLVNNTEIRGGALFKERSEDETSSHVLCAYQVIRLKNVKKLFPLMNALLSDAIIKGEPSNEDFPLSFNQWREIAKKGNWRWCQMDKTSFIVNLPMHQDEYFSYRNHILGDYGYIMANNFFGIIQKADRIQLVLGDPQLKVNSYKYDINKHNEYSNLLPLIEKSVFWDDEIDPQEIIQQFTKDPQTFFNSMKKREP